MRARPALKMRGKSKVRYAYAITAALLLGGTAIAVASHNPVGAQTAQNEGPAMQAVAPRGAPTSFANMVERLQPAVVNISTRQHVEEIGKASCRERVCQYVWIWVVAV